MDISIMIEGQQGLNWPHWKRLVAEVEELGFAGLFRSDHFTDPEPPDQDSLELVVSLAYAADHSQRIHFGPLVAPVSFRDPVMFTRQALALADLSNGRMILGLGAGWQEREHAAGGYELGDVSTRLGRLEEALQFVTRLVRSEEPVEFDGDFYTLKGGARFVPRGPLPILIGGNGPKRTLPLVARYADIWNGVFLSPDAFRERSASLDALLTQAGRKPEEVRRTLMLALFFGRDMAELDRRTIWRKDQPETANTPLPKLLEQMRNERNNVAGTPEVVIEQLRTYAAAGVQEIMLQWFDLDDLDGLRAFAEDVLGKV